MAKKEQDNQQYLKNVGSRLKYLRKKKGYTSAEKFAYAHDLNRVQYSRYEAGGDMRLTSLKKVLEALDVSFANFFSDGFD